jgi:endonuclease/exonuclease/phosphatase (EEP) superfamily protein YafD
MHNYSRTFRTAIARMSDRVQLKARSTVPLGEAKEGTLGVSRDGTLTVADVEHAGETITCISAYSVWENVISSAAKPWIISDASAHRMISDLSALIANQKHRMIVAGDFNLMRGQGEHGDPYWARRYATVFDRMEAIGLRCVGPSAPNGRQAEPRPDELPHGSKNVPTYHSTQQTPATATRQLDYVFASESIADRVQVCALNGVEEWGPSDHCRLVIDV